MQLINRFKLMWVGVFVSFGCFATEPPCWSTEEEGASAGDACWFVEKLASGDLYSWGVVEQHNNKLRCFYSNPDEERYFKEFGWIRTSFDGLKEHFTGGLSTKKFIASYKWCNPNTQKHSVKLPDTNVSEVSESTVCLKQMNNGNMDSIALGVMNSSDGVCKILGKRIWSPSGEKKLVPAYVWHYMGCGWARTGHSSASHHGPNSGWKARLLDLTKHEAISYDRDGNHQDGKWIDLDDCQDGNQAYVKVEEGITGEQLKTEVNKYRTPRY